jgi:glycosyltransferase involved in cell wall biosynthesis
VVEKSSIPKNSYRMGLNFIFFKLHKLEKIFWRYMSSVDSPNLPIYLKPDNGLANRLRCLSSFAKFAELNKRELFLCWVKGPGFSDDAFGDLFNSWPSFIKLISEKEYSDAAGLHFNLDKAVFKNEQYPELYNYKYNVDFIFETMMKKIFCYQGNSCIEYMLDSKFSGRYSDNNLIRRISINKTIDEKIKKITNKFKNTIGIHIRKGDAITSPWKKYYQVSTTDSFKKIIDKEISNDPDVKFYLSTDCEKTHEEIKNQYEDRIIYQNKAFFKSEDERAEKPLQKEALIDLICLSKTKKIIGSHWSSFSDFASSINNIELETAMHSYDKNVSIIVASKNRTNSLKVCLNSWLRFNEIAEIIIVDWSSDDRIDYLQELDPRIKVINVEGKDEFDLAAAYNLASKYVTKDFLLKMDADYVLSPYSSIFSNYKIRPGEFLTGDYHDVDKDNNCGFLSYLNGMLLVRVEDFRSVDGYFEELVGYGYDDCDLYSRLEISGLKRRRLDHKEICVFHVPHSDSERSKHYKDKDIKESLMKNVSRSLKNSNIIDSSPKKTVIANENHSSPEKPVVICYPGIGATYNLNAHSILAMAGGDAVNFVHQYAIYGLVKSKKMFAREFNYDTDRINKECRCLVVPSYDFLSEKTAADDFASFLEKIKLPILFASIGFKSENYGSPKNLSSSSLRIINLIKNRELSVGVRGEESKKILEEFGISEIHKIGCPSNFINEDADLYDKLKNKFIKKSTKIIFNQKDILSDNPDEIRLQKKFISIFKDLSGFFVQQGAINFIRSNNSYEIENNFSLIKEKIASEMGELEFEKFVTQFFRFYISVDQWMEDASRMDLSMGFKIQGNMAAHQSGCPAIWIHSDAGTKEMVELMDLPRLSLKDAISCDSIEDFKSKCICDYDKCKKTRNDLKNNLIELFKKFGIQTY